MAGDWCQGAVASNQGRAQYFCQSNIGGVVSSGVTPQLPDAREKGLVGIPRHRQVYKVGQRFACPLIGQIPSGTIPTENLGYFDVDQVGA